MVKKQNRKSSRRLFLYVGIVVLALLLVAGGAYALYHRNNRNRSQGSPKISTRPENSVNYSHSNPSDNATNDQRKASSSPATTLDNGSSSNTNTTLGTKIVSTRVSGGNLHVGTMVTGTTSGTCKISASQSGQQTVTLFSSSVTQDVNSYDCGIINIATSKFPSSGSWKLNLTVTNNGQQATDTADITVPSGG